MEPFLLPGVWEGGDIFSIRFLYDLQKKMITGYVIKEQYILRETENVLFMNFSLTVYCFT